jgi:ABC-type phosphate transport system substrate-binding protein
MRRMLTGTLMMALLVVIALWSCLAEAQDVAVVVNLKNPATALTSTELRKVFSGQKRAWSGGTPVRLFVRAPGAHEREILLSLLKMSERDYKSYWTVAMFRGDVQSEPVSLFSNGMQKEAIVTYPGAIALVDLQDIKPGMKILRIDGTFPGARGYPLK